MPKSATTSKPKCPMVRARERAGLTVEQAAKKAYVSPAYLKRFEGRGGGPPEILARRLANLYGCPLDDFLPTGQRKTTSGVKAVKAVKAVKTVPTRSSEEGLKCE